MSVSATAFFNQILGIQVMSLALKLCQCILEKLYLSQSYVSVFWQNLKKNSCKILSVQSLKSDLYLTNSIEHSLGELYLTS